MPPCTDAESAPATATDPPAIVGMTAASASASAPTPGSSASRPSRAVRSASAPVATGRPTSIAPMSAGAGVLSGPSSAGRLRAPARPSLSRSLRAVARRAIASACLPPRRAPVASESISLASGSSSRSGIGEGGGGGTVPSASGRAVLVTSVRRSSSWSALRTCFGNFRSRSRTPTTARTSARPGAAAHALVSSSHKSGEAGSLEFEVASLAFASSSSRLWMRFVTARWTDWPRRLAEKERRECAGCATESSTGGGGADGAALDGRGSCCTTGGGGAEASAVHSTTSDWTALAPPSSAGASAAAGPTA
mmetsp:Transcript_20840/g.49366  ORF Transcript_20840/g.49366 Transcript_20840/m.49366 type:complete len:308 (+) Transcript_20840:223-1146(+)